jgi:hypothetical protein
MEKKIEDGENFLSGNRGFLLDKFLYWQIYQNNF